MLCLEAYNCLGHPWWSSYHFLVTRYWKLLKSLLCISFLLFIFSAKSYWQCVCCILVNSELYSHISISTWLWVQIIVRRVSYLHLKKLNFVYFEIKQLKILDRPLLVWFSTFYGKESLVAVGVNERRREQERIKETLAKLSSFTASWQF